MPMAKFMISMSSSSLAPKFAFPIQARKKAVSLRAIHCQMLCDRSFARSSFCVTDFVLLADSPPPPPVLAHAVSALTQLCSQNAFLTNSSFRSEMRHHLSTLRAQHWHSAGASTNLVSSASKAMCCVLRSGDIGNQYAATRIIVALGSASKLSRRAMCSVIAVECSREVGE
jgi:hypothetical protein